MIYNCKVMVSIYSKFFPVWNYFSFQNSSLNLENICGKDSNEEKQATLSSYLEGKV